MPQEHEVYDEMPFRCQAVCANVSKKFQEEEADYSMSEFMDWKEKRVILKSYTHLSFFLNSSVYFLAVCKPVETLYI